MQIRAQVNGQWVVHIYSWPEKDLYNSHLLLKASHIEILEEFRMPTSYCKLSNKLLTFTNMTLSEDFLKYPYHFRTVEYLSLETVYPKDLTSHFFMEIQKGLPFLKKITISHIKHNIEDEQKLFARRVFQNSNVWIH